MVRLQHLLSLKSNVSSYRNWGMLFVNQRSLRRLLLVTLLWSSQMDVDLLQYRGQIPYRWNVTLVQVAHADDP